MRMLRFPPFPPAIADLASRRRTASRGDLRGVHPERACRGGCGAAGADPEVVPPSGWNLGGVDGRKGGFSGENGIVSAGGPAGRGPGDAGKTVNGGAEGWTRPPVARRSRHRPLRHVPGLTRSARSRSSSLPGRRPGTVRVPGFGYGRGMRIGCGAEGGTRTPTWLPTLDPESSASANSATSAPCCGTTKYSKGLRPGKRENAFPGAMARETHGRRGFAGTVRCGVQYSVSQIRLHSRAAASAPASLRSLRRTATSTPQSRASPARRIDALGATPYL